MGRMSKNDFIQFLWKELPYGVTIFEDGTMQLFNRDYEPIYSRKPLDSSVWVVPMRKRGLHVFRGVVPKDGVRDMIWFYNDRCPPWRVQKVRNACKEILQRW